MQLTVITLEGEKIPDNIKNSITKLEKTFHSLKINYYEAPKSNAPYSQPFPWIEFNAVKEYHSARGEKDTLSLLDKICSMKKVD